MTALEYAILDIGYTEYPANSNRTKYGEWYGMNGVSWCMEAVQYWFNAAGTPLPYKTASCSALLNWYKKNKPECVKHEPKKGDIVIYNFGHTGIVESSDNLAICAIEGNTSSGSAGSQSNGGGVFRRTRAKTTVTAYIRPFEEAEKPKTTVATTKEGEKMKTIKGSTSNETKMIKAIQTAVGANADGEIGTQTMSDIAIKVGADCFPLTLTIYSNAVIIAKDVLPFAGKGKPLGVYANTINGSFYASGLPCSILISGGRVIQEWACHASCGKPESVMYKLYDGTVGIKRVSRVTELPNGAKWAVGGLGLLDNYNPTAEGFCKLNVNGKVIDFSDVLRKTNHSMLGYKNGYFYLCYCKNMTAAQVNAYAKRLGLQYAIQLDGGHIAGINGGESFAKINTSIGQYYIIQGESAK